MKSCTLACALVLVSACSSPPSGGGGTGSTPQGVTEAPPPAIDSRLLGVWAFVGQIRSSVSVVCGRDVACVRETLRFTADGSLTMESEQYGTARCTYTADGDALTYRCGSGAAVTQDYGFTDSGVTLCVWQNAGLAYCYSHV